MPCYSTAIVTTHIPSPPNLHHVLRPRSLEDRLRIKQQMILSHVLLGIHCLKHYQGFVFIHYMSFCNCSGYTKEEVDPIVKEVVVDMLQPLEAYFAKEGVPLFSWELMANTFTEEILLYQPNDSIETITCHHKFLKLFSLRMADAELKIHPPGVCGSAVYGFINSQRTQETYFIQISVRDMLTLMNQMSEANHTTP